MVLQEKLLTADDLWEISHREPGKRFELVQGVLIEMSPVGGLHGIIALKIGSLLLAHVEHNRLGVVTVETGYILENAPQTVRAPDVGFVRHERMPQPFGPRYIPIAPDLAVEVVSPGDAASEVEAKVLDYLRAGVALVWVIYPDTHTVMAHTAGDVQRRGPGDTLDGGAVLPGFTVSVSAIFPE